MQGAAATLSTQPTKKPFKQVRYQDDQERYEDREDVLPYNPPAPQTHRPPARGEPPQTQYVLKSKTSSADSEARNHPSPPQPVRSIPLPSGPSYDPQDEEDLRREATYQQELKNRVNTLQRTAESTVIPHIDSSESDDLLPTEMEQEAGPRYQHHRDSLSMYDGQRVSQNMYAGAPSWGETGYSQPQGGYSNPEAGYSNPEAGYSNPEAGYSNPEAGYSKPQSYATAAQRGYADPEGYAGGGYSRTQPGYGDTYHRERYEETDYPGPAAHPPRDDYTEDVQQEHSGQHGSPSRGMMGTYSQQGYAEPRDGYYLTEPRGYTQSQKPAPIYNQAFTGEGGGERGAHQAPSPTMDDHHYQMEEDAQQRPGPPQFSGLITLPSRPDYDYVSHNKVDYGFSQKRTYKKISEVKTREEERLSHIFVHPTAKKGSRDNSPTRPVNSTGQPPLAITYSPTGEGAVQGQEDLWTHLSQSINPKLSPTHSLPFTHPGDITQPRITQHLVTEDGQRISVDVNLRLVSPPVGSEGEEFTDQPHFRQTGMQYPMIQQGGRTPRDLVHSGSHDYGDSVYTTTVTTNPYKKIPPIGSEGSPNSEPVQSEGSYMLSYLRGREKQMASQDKPWYRIYGLKDYKRMQKEVQLGRGTLGPDLENETFREKRDKSLRKLDYAKAVKDRNAKELMNRRPSSFPRPREQDDMLSKRKLAVEYAKHVPKPTVKPKATAHNSYELASKLSPIAKSSGKGQQQPNGQDKVSNGSVEVLDLDKLHKRHQQDKRSADLIQQKAQGVVS